jgi:hypothetical protein
MLSGSVLQFDELPGDGFIVSGRFSDDSEA